MRIAKILLLVTFYLLASGCAQSARKDHLPQFHSLKPRSILIVPIANKSVDVDAPLALITTLPRVLADDGYYVFPINTVKTLLDHEGLYEAGEVHAKPPGELAELFGADCILYVTINKWKTEYILIHSTTIVDLEYSIVSSRGEQLWSNRQVVKRSSDGDSNSGGGMAGLLSAAIGAAIERAMPQFMPLARQANEQAFHQGQKALPPGPYARNYDQYYLALNPPKEPK